MGLLLVIIVMGLISICIGECVAELTQRFPVYSAIVEYIRAFVDDEWGQVAGLAYWYCFPHLLSLRQVRFIAIRYAFASIFALENLSAASLTEYWGLPQTWQTLAFYVLSPVCIILLNLFPVFVSLHYCYWAQLDYLTIC
jgi:yeast amino acid transporter